MTKDTRIAYGFGCTWWDSISEVATKGDMNLPCCPHCRGNLYEVESEAEWFAKVDEHEKRGNPGYREIVEWMRGKCFPTYPEALAAFKKEKEG